MDELYILRHGIAVEHGTSGIPDDDRPLTPKGEKRMREIAVGLAEIGLKLDRIVTSPLPRARRTAEIVAESLGLEDRLENADLLRAGGDAQPVADWLHTLSDDRLMIVGHNPMLDELLSLLLLGKPDALPFSFKKGGVAALNRPADRLELAWLAPPRLLRRKEDD
jgi:phosphohistidine phosphatase